MDHRSPLALRIAFDACAYTRFVEANQAYDPERDPDACRIQRIAAFRIYLYSPRLPELPPSVKVEYEAIRERTKLVGHQRAHDLLFHDLDPSEELNVEAAHARAAELSAWHAYGDCRVLAECEQFNVDILVTDDRTFQKRLAPYTHVHLLRPDECFKRLEVAPGTPPRCEPEAQHPLFGARWWRV